MRRTLRTMALTGVLAVGGALGFSPTLAHAQEVGRYDSGVGYGNRAKGCGDGNDGLPSYNPSLPWSPAQQQGWCEGRVYYETGIAPNHPLSPAEMQGFVAGERRQAHKPWQIDPAKQQGWRKGQIYWETGQLPNRPLSPAELQGFSAGERRAAYGGFQPW